jgi:hypothetical protein
MLALFSATDLIAQHRGQLTLDELLVEVDTPAATGGAEAPVMPASWELLPREDILGQGVLGA